MAAPRLGSHNHILRVRRFVSGVCVNFFILYNDTGFLQLMLFLSNQEPSINYNLLFLSIF